MNQDKTYIHPNFSPSNNSRYLMVVGKLRGIAATTHEDVIYVSKDEYDVLEDAVHNSKKGHGHQVYGKIVIIKT
jgi:hypothetical protein